MSNSFPQEFIRRLKQLNIDPAVFKKKPTTFRINTLKINHLQLPGFEFDFVPNIPGAFILNNKSQKELTQTDVYKNGEIYVQSLSSMMPALVLDPKPGEKILDITAAPGSKTTQMAALMENRGEIVANDASFERIYRLKANLAVQGVTIARVIKNDARAIWQQFPEYFDRVLVDVPCSMEGRFQTNNPKTYQDWSIKKIKILAQLQKWILRSAVSATKPGGTLVYSTCTLNHEENENVIDWILKKEKGNIELVKMERINPSELMEGFFIAKIRKLNSNVRM